MRVLFAAFLLSLALVRPATAADPEHETAILAGGCFWCVEADFDQVPGVLETVSGYTGGHLDRPTYEQVGRKATGHHEAVRITYDPQVLGYEEVLAIFWRSIDPTDAGGQFCDRGEPYETGVFVLNETQRAIAERSKAEAEAALGRPIVTPVESAGPFWPAEDYHQDYHDKSAIAYKFYRWRCGRDQRIRELWGDQAHRGIGKE